MSNSKSEYNQLIDYINKNNNSQVKKIIKKKEIINEPETVYIDNRLKKFFDITHIYSEERFIKFIHDSLKSDIIEESKFNKSFYTCKEIIECHRKIYYASLNYDISINNDYIVDYKNYIQKINFRNMLLELCNFERNQIIINFKNKIKDIIPVIQDGVMIDFIYGGTVNEKIYKLKAFIYNQNNETNLIKYIKIILILDNFDDIKIINIKIDDNDDHLIERLNILRNYIHTKNIPNIEYDCEICKKCLYFKYCVDKNNTTSQDISQDISKDNISDGKKIIKLRNTFMF